MFKSCRARHLPDDPFLEEALREAEKALDHEDVPVGCVVARDGRVLGRAHNQRELLKDPTAHAEILALTQAAAALESWRLEGCTVYVTLEPCAMCAGALVLARVDRLIYGAPDPKAGACGSVMDVVRHPKLNHQVDVIGGVEAERCAELLRRFFRARRNSEPLREEPA